MCSATHFPLFLTLVTASNDYTAETAKAVQNSVYEDQHISWKKSNAIPTQSSHSLLASSSDGRSKTGTYVDPLKSLAACFLAGLANGRWRNPSTNDVGRRGHTRASRQRANVQLADKDLESLCVRYTIPVPEDVSETVFPNPELKQAIALHEEYVGKLDAADLVKAGFRLPDAFPFPELDLNFPGLKVWHVDPLVLTVEDFFSDADCDKEIALHEVDDASSVVQYAKKDGCTSTNWCISYDLSTQYMARAAALLGVDQLQKFGPRQLIRYREGEIFFWHWDASPTHEVEPGGNRLVTLLLYFNDVQAGGKTQFRWLRTGGTIGTEEILSITPKKGRFLIFFPSFKDEPDLRMFHAGAPPEKDSEKWISTQHVYQKICPTTSAHHKVKGSTQAKAAPAVHAYAQEHSLRPIDLSASMASQTVSIGQELIGERSRSKDVGKASKGKTKSKKTSSASKGKEKVKVASKGFR